MKKTMKGILFASKALEGINYIKIVAEHYIRTSQKPYLEECIVMGQFLKEQMELETKFIEADIKVLKQQLENANL
jgi:hypothetical protein